MIPTSTLMITMESQISAIDNVLEMCCASDFGLPEDTNELQQCNGGTEDKEWFGQSKWLSLTRKLALLALQVGDSYANDKNQRKWIGLKFNKDI